MLLSNQALGKYLEPQSVNIGLTRSKVQRDRQNKATLDNHLPAAPRRLGDTGKPLQKKPAERGTWDSSFVSNEPSYIGQYMPVRVSKPRKKLGATYPTFFHTQDEAQNWINRQEMKIKNRREADPQRQVNELMLDKLKGERRDQLRKLQNMYLTEDKREELNRQQLNSKSMALGENFQDVFANADLQAREEVQEPPPLTDEQSITEEHEQRQHRQDEQSLQTAQQAVAGAGDGAVPGVGVTPDPSDTGKSVGTAARRNIKPTQRGSTGSKRSTRSRAREMASKLSQEYGKRVRDLSRQEFGRKPSDLTISQVNRLEKLLEG